MRTICLFILLLSIGCGNPPPLVPQNLTASIYFWAYFGYVLAIKIRKSGDSATLVITAIAQDSLQTIAATDSLNLTPEEFGLLYARTDSSYLLRLPDYDAGDMDGYSYKGQIEQGGRTAHFETANVDDRVAIHETFQRNLFSLLNKTCRNTRAHVELSQQAFEFKFPVTILSRRPYIARIFSRIQDDDRDKLMQFFRGVPISEPAIIDLRYLQMIDRDLLPDMVQFGKERPKLVYVVADDRRAFLKEAGIDSAKMVSSMEEAALRSGVQIEKIF